VTDDERPVVRPAADEIARALAEADAAVERMAAVPESERLRLGGDKYSGPVGTETLLGPDDDPGRGA
jgi:hypothetical protein